MGAIRKRRRVGSSRQRGERERTTFAREEARDCPNEAKGLADASAPRRALPLVWPPAAETRELAKRSTRTRDLGREAPAADSFQVQARVQAAQTAAVPHLYFNGFVSTLSTGDVVCVLERNGLPVGLLNMSFTVAKSLSVSLGGVVAALEKISERDMLTTKDLEGMFASEEKSR